MSAHIFSKKSVQSNFHEAAFTMMTTIVYDTLDVVSQGPQMLDPMKLNPSTLMTPDLMGFIVASETTAMDMAILSFRNLSNTCGFSRFLLRWCLKIQFDTLHFEACSLVIQAMEPWTFCKWSFFLKKEWFSIFSVQFLHTKHWLTYPIFPMRTTERLYNILWIYPSNSHHQNRHCWVRGLDPKHPPFPVLDFWKQQNCLGSPYTMSLLEGRWVAVDGACHNNN